MASKNTLPKKMYIQNLVGFRLEKRSQKFRQRVLFLKLLGKDNLFSKFWTITLLNPEGCILKISVLLYLYIYWRNNSVMTNEVPNFNFNSTLMMVFLKLQTTYAYWSFQITCAFYIPLDDANSDHGPVCIRREKEAI